MDVEKNAGANKHGGMNTGVFEMKGRARPAQGSKAHFYFVAAVVLAVLAAWASLPA